MSNKIKKTLFLAGIFALGIILTGCTSSKSTQSSSDVDTGSIVPSITSNVSSPPVPPEPTRPTI